MRKTTLSAWALALLLTNQSYAQDGCQWHAASDAPAAKLEAPSEVVDGKLLVLGGFLGGLTASPRMDLFDPATNSWTQRADMPTAVTHYGWASDGPTIWVAGGFLGDHPGQVIDDVWHYDSQTDQWGSGPALPEVRGSGGLFRLGRELHFVGGVGADRDTDQADHWVLDLDNLAGGWGDSDPLPVARNHFATVTLGDRAYVIGGQLRHDTTPMDLPLVHAFDVNTGWSQLADLPYARSHFEPSTFVCNGKLVIAGGRSNTLGLVAVADVHTYDPLADQWSQSTPLPGPLLAPAMKLIDDEYVLTGGALQASTPTAETWTAPAVDALPAFLRVNAGGNSLNLSEAWCGDFGSFSGFPFANASLTSVANTPQQELYLTERTGANSNPTQFAYALPVDAGTYRVRLHFAEIYWGAPGGGPGGAGKRVFSVQLEGQTVLQDYDIWADVGPAAAVVHEFDVAVADGELGMQFSASVDRPKLSAFEVIRHGAPAVYCDTAANSVGAGATIGFQGTASLQSNDFTLLASGTPPQVAGLFLRSSSQTQLPFQSGYLCVGAPFLRMSTPLPTDGNGSLAFDLDLAQMQAPDIQITAGSHWNFQFIYRDSGLGTVNTSDALSVIFLP